MFFHPKSISSNRISNRIQIILRICIRIHNYTVSRYFVIPSVYLTFYIIGFFYIIFINYISVQGIRFPFIIFNIRIL